MMLEGKVPVNMAALHALPGTNNNIGGSPIIQEKVVYRDIENK